MPLPLAAIAAGASAAGSIINPFLQARENRRNREYNMPINQMARLKAAGLNPHLVYGNGANAQMPSQQAPQVDAQAMPQALQAFQNLAIQQVEKDKLQAQVELLKTQEKLAQESILNRRQATESAALKYSFDSGLFETNTTMQKEKLRGLGIINEGNLIKNAGNLTRNETMRLMQQPTLEKLIQETLLTKARRSMIPYQKDLLTAQAKNLDQSRLLTELKQIDQRNKNSVFKETHDLMMRNVQYREGQITQQELENNLLRIKTRFKDMGLSETATQDMIEMFTPGGLIKSLGSKKKMTAKDDQEWMRRGRERFEEIRRANQNK